MMKRKRLRFKTVALLCCIFGIFSVVLAAPGAEDDPLISKSYIENNVIPQLKQYVESRLAESGAGNSNTQESGTAAKFSVVEATSGSEIICAAGTELILRMGSADIIATEKGGIADTTAGFDLGSGTAMPANHMLIVPVSDGRGIKAKTDIIVLIKGGYTVK